MIIIPYESFGNIQFSDSISSVEEKLNDYKVEMNTKDAINRKQKTLYVFDLSLLIVFSDENGASIEYFEVENGEAKIDDLVLFSTSYNVIKTKIQDLDKNLKIEEDGFYSSKFGFGVYCGLNNGEYTKYPERVIVFNSEYLNKETPSVDDILNHFL